MLKKILAASAAIIIFAAGIGIVMINREKDATRISQSETPEPGIIQTGGSREEAIEPEQDVDINAVLATIGFQFPTESFEAPGFSIPDISKEIVSLEDQRGKVVLLNLWATWCPPCREEMPSMLTLYEEYKDSGFTILAVSSTQSNDTFEKVEQFATDYNLTFPVLFDDTGELPLSYHTGSIPVSYIIDKKGLIIARIVGSIDWDTPSIKRVIEELLET